MAYGNLTVSGNNAVGQDAETAVQSDTVNLATTASGGTPSVSYCYRAIFCGGAGTLKIRTLKGNDVTFTGVVAGQIIPVAAIRVWSTGTTATNIVGIL